MGQVFAVSVPIASRDNFVRGLDRHVWGWKDAPYDRRPSRPVFDAAAEGDLLVFGYGGGGRNRQTWDGRSIGRVVICVTSSGHYESLTRVWADLDEIYPHRINFEVVADLHGVPGAPVELKDALQQSLVGNGAPYRVEATDPRSLVLSMMDGGLDQVANADMADPKTDFTGATDGQAIAARRLEQSWLRKQVVGGGPLATCALCGRRLPVRLVRAAHIVKRSLCTEEQRRDLANVMAACLLGCDELFEHGLVRVGTDGAIAAGSGEWTPDLEEAVDQLVGRRCTAHDDRSAEYFQAHELAHP